MKLLICFDVSTFSHFKYILLCWMKFVYQLLVYVGTLSSQISRTKVSATYDAEVIDMLECFVQDKALPVPTRKIMSGT